MTDKIITLGQAIDQIISALEALDENSRQTAINAACQHIGLNPTQATITPQVNTPIIANNSDQVSAAPVSAQQLDIRALKEQKAPTSAAQMACVVAYYLQELASQDEHKDSVNVKDLEKYFKQAKFKLPKTISQLLRDSKSAGYFDSAAGTGEYKLNAVGYNLVAHNLPKGKSK